MEARTEFNRRKSLGSAYRSETRHFTSSTAWMRTAERIVIPPKSMVPVRCYVEEERPVGEYFTMMSRFLLEANEDILVPSVSYDELDEPCDHKMGPCFTKRDFHRIPVENCSDQEYVMEKDFVLGDIVSHPPDSSNDDF